MQLLGDATRFKMFKLLTKKQDMCVSEIANELTISPSAVSQHFRQFELLGLVEKHRMGQKICYVLSEDDPLVTELMKLTNQ
jgi:predicted transcriptional regulator